MTSVVKCLNRRYSNIGDGREVGFLFMSCSPESKRGLLPNIISLNGYNIEVMGARGSPGDGPNDCHTLKHIAFLDLTDNLLSDWDEVFNILQEFTNLEFLNLTNNLLCGTVASCHHPARQRVSGLRKLVLNGNKITWETVHYLLGVLPLLEELHLSTNNLQDISDETFGHNNLRILYLSCNPITDMKKLQDHLVFHCPNLECLTLAECPISHIPRLENPELNTLKALNLSCSQVNSWQQLDNINSYHGLSELKVAESTLLASYTAHERRLMVIALLPNIKVLNGGDKINPLEREDAERAFIRHYLYSESVEENDRPSRVDELIEVHGLLEPLANIDLSPEISVNVTIKYKVVLQTLTQIKLL